MPPTMSMPANTSPRSESTIVNVVISGGMVKPAGMPGDDIEDMMVELTSPQSDISAPTAPNAMAMEPITVGHCEGGAWSVPEGVGAWGGTAKLLMWAG